jgi:multiple sugar transport system permease protein
MVALQHTLLRARRRSRTRVKLGKQARREERTFYLFISLWIVGLVLFDAGPIAASFVLSLTDWSMLGDPNWIGLSNYDRMVNDSTFFTALWNSVYFGVGSVGLGVTVSFLLALLLNQPVLGVSLFRTIFYLPAVVSGIAVAILWTNILHPDYGLINGALARIGINGPGWLQSPDWAMPGLILMSVWGAGGSMVIFLAGLQGVPQHLYEAASIDGAGWWRKFWNVTIPMMSPVIFYNLVVGFIVSLQSFVLILIMTDGRPANSTLVLGLYLYRNAFTYLDLGYASALAWVLLIVILIITAIQFIAAKFWVYYEAGPTR